MSTVDLPRTRSSSRLTRAERAALSDKKLIQAALELIAESGIEKVTLRSIGERAGYSRGLVNYRFGTKEALLREATRRLVDYWAEDVPPDVASTTTSLGALQHFITHTRASVERSLESRAYYSLVYAALGPMPELKEDLARVHGEIKRRLASWIRSGIGSGEIRAEASPESAAAWVYAAARGIAFQWFIDPASIDLEQTYAGLSHGVQKSLGASG